MKYLISYLKSQANSLLAYLESLRGSDSLFIRYNYQRIYYIISIIYLELYYTNNLYYRRPPLPLLIIVDGKSKYVINKILNKRRLYRGRGQRIKYLVRQRNYSLEDNTQEPKRNVTKTIMINIYEQLNGANISIRYLYFKYNITKTVALNTYKRLNGTAINLFIAIQRGVILR